MPLGYVPGLRTACFVPICSGKSHAIIPCIYSELSRHVDMLVHKASWTLDVAILGDEASSTFIVTLSSHKASSTPDAAMLGHEASSTFDAAILDYKKITNLSVWSSQTMKSHLSLIRPCWECHINSILEVYSALWHTLLLGVQWGQMIVGNMTWRANPINIHISLLISTWSTSMPSAASSLKP